jgi:uncharacterized protein (TIGR02594 family)
MTDTVPPWLVTMRQVTGTHALNDNPIILGWAKKIGELFPEMASYCATYTHDTIAWCGLTVGYCMAVNGIRPIFGAKDADKFFFAEAWKQFGTPVSSPQPGDVLVFDFGGGDHHVTLYEQKQGDSYVCRGGNQSHQVKLSTYAISQCIGVRRPPVASISVQPTMPTLAVQLFSGITATVFGGAADLNTSAYDGHLIDDVEHGVALPYRFADPRPNVCVWNAGQSVVCKIVDVGPWNTNDPYWQTGTRPEAESGVDSRGRPTNRAGIDLTPGAASAIGIKGKGTVDWEFVDASQLGPKPPVITSIPPSAQSQQLIKMLEAMMAGITTTPNVMTVPATQVNLAALIQQVLALMQTMPTPASQPATTIPPQSQDQIQQFISILTALIDSANGQSTGALGQVNGALGQTIGNLLDGKKSAIGIIGAMLTAVLQNVGPNLSTAIPLVGSWAGLGSAAMPIFLGLAAWGVLGKLEKWFQSSPKSNK